MTQEEALRELGLKEIRPVSEHTTTIQFVRGGVTPATTLELRMWSLIQHLLK